MSNSLFVDTFCDYLFFSFIRADQNNGNNPLSETRKGREPGAEKDISHQRPNDARSENCIHINLMINDAGIERLIF